MESRTSMPMKYEIRRASGHHLDLTSVKQISILDIAKKLGIEIKGKKAMCFSGHDKKSASLCFDSAKGLWKCFGCGKGGSGVDLVMTVLGCDFKASLDWFAHEYSLDVRGGHNTGSGCNRNNKHPKRAVVPKKMVAGEEKQIEFSADTEVYGWLISQCREVTEAKGLDYLRSHGISADVANRFGIRELRFPAKAFKGMIERWGEARVYRSGLAWGETGKPNGVIWSSYAILFPFKAESGVSYIQGRMFCGNAKYLNPRGVLKPLFNTDRLSGLKTGDVIHICEGVPDALALESCGVPAIGVLGASSFRAEWVDLFMRFDVVLLPDGDQGGETFRKTISGLFAERGKGVRVVRLPAGKDVAEIIAEMRSKL